MSQRQEPYPPALLDAVLAIGSDLDLQTVLHRIVQAATRLVDAQYGALAVLGDSGAPAQFVTVGMDADTIAKLGPTPQGHGLVGVLIKDPRPLRLHDLTKHPQSHGFPPNHPVMRTFLGVPIRVRDEVFGNLYLTEKAEGKDFDQDDEKVTVALAAAAGVAIENARLYGDTTRRTHWLRASAEVTTSLLSGTEPDDVLRLVAERAQALAQSDVAAIALPMGDSLAVEVAFGDLAGQVRGLRLGIDASVVGAVFTSGKSLTVPDLRTAPLAAGGHLLRADLQSAIFVPLRAADSTLGVLYVANLRGGQAFGPADEELLHGFASQAALALELARQRRDNEQLSVFRDRDRIARDLHDLVIQQLFATGMRLEGSLRHMSDPRARAPVEAAVDELDKTIKEIRATIYALQRPEGARRTLRAAIVELVESYAPMLGFSPALRMDGLVDTRVPPTVGENMLAVIRETLANTVRHARASRAEVVVSVDEANATVTVLDDGVGLTAYGRRSGLANLQARADELHGQFRAAARAGGGTEVSWRAPLD